MMRWMSDLYRSQRPEMAADVAGQERRLRESQMDWTIVRPPRIKAALPTGKVALGPQVNVGMLSSIGLGDLTKVLLDLAEQGDYIRECIYIKEK
jgi:putative NADH-flavin reductase